MARFEIARNTRSTLYEVHAEGCQHLIASHLEKMSTVEAETGADAAAGFEARNDGVETKLGPCAKDARPDAADRWRPIFTVVDAEGAVVELLDDAPRWDWPAAHQRVFLANVNGGDAVELDSPAHPELTTRPASRPVFLTERQVEILNALTGWALDQDHDAPDDYLGDLFGFSAEDVDGVVSALNRKAAV